MQNYNQCCNTKADADAQVTVIDLNILRIVHQKKMVVMAALLGAQDCGFSIKTGWLVSEQANS